MPCFNNLTYLTRMLGQLQRLGFEDIIVIDNASSFPPLLAYLDSPEPEITAVKENENHGPRALFQNREKYASLPQHFCLTDPDLKLNLDLPTVPCAADWTDRALQDRQGGVRARLSDTENMIRDEFLIRDIYRATAKFSFLLQTRSPA